jgi:hypothetical protein
VACCKIYRSGSLAPKDLERDNRRGRIAIAQKDLYASPGKDLGSLTGKTFSHEPGIAADDDTSVFFTRSKNMVGNGLGHDPDIVEYKILTEYSPPSGRTERDSSHIPSCRCLFTGLLIVIEVNKTL